MAGYDLEKESSNTDEVLEVVFSLVRDRAIEIGALFGHDESSVGVKSLAGMERGNVLISISPTDVVKTGVSMTTVLVVALVKLALGLDVLPGVASTGEVGLWYVVLCFIKTTSSFLTAMES